MHCSFTFRFFSLFVVVQNWKKKDMAQNDLETWELVDVELEDCGKPVMRSRVVNLACDKDSVSSKAEETVGLGLTLHPLIRLFTGNRWTGRLSDIIDGPGD